MSKIVVSFKNTTKDQKIYAAIYAMEEKSAFIKEACEFYLKYISLNKSSKDGLEEI
ncbi:MAG TPA: hypothetical protein VIK72_19540 [Clostridiaceae bacterium]